MAAGEGLRAGDELPKQFHRLLGIPMLWWSVKAFYDEDPETRISIVMHPGYFAEYDICVSELPDEFRRIPVRLVAGGRNRSHSVANGILRLPDTENALIAVHDAARPMVSKKTIRDAWQQAASTGTAVPVVPVTDSLRESDGNRSFAVDRSRFVAVQTPQVFRADILKMAFREDDSPNFTDEASRVEKSGHRIALTEGSPENMKVTNPLDFKIAEILLQNKMG